MTSCRAAVYRYSLFLLELSILVLLVGDVQGKLIEFSGVSFSASSGYNLELNSSTNCGPSDKIIFLRCTFHFGVQINGECQGGEVVFLASSFSGYSSSAGNTFRNSASWYNRSKLVIEGCKFPTQGKSVLNLCCPEARNPIFSNSYLHPVHFVSSMILLRENEFTGGTGMDMVSPVWLSQCQTFQDVRFTYANNIVKNFKVFVFHDLIIEGGEFLFVNNLHVHPATSRTGNWGNITFVNTLVVFHSNTFAMKLNARDFYMMKFQFYLQQGSRLNVTGNSFEVEEMQGSNIPYLASLWLQIEGPAAASSAIVPSQSIIHVRDNTFYTISFCNYHSSYSGQLKIDAKDFGSFFVLNNNFTIDKKQASPCVYRLSLIYLGLLDVGVRFQIEANNFTVHNQLFGNDNTEEMLIGTKVERIEQVFSISQNVFSPLLGSMYLPHFINISRIEVHGNAVGSITVRSCEAVHQSFSIAENKLFRSDEGIYSSFSEFKNIAFWRIENNTLHAPMLLDTVQKFEGIHRMRFSGNTCLSWYCLRLLALLGVGVNTLEISGNILSTFPRNLSTGSSLQFYHIFDAITGTTPRLLFTNNSMWLNAYIPTMFFGLPGRWHDGDAYKIYERCNTIYKEEIIEVSEGNSTSLKSNISVFCDGGMTTCLTGNTPPVRLHWLTCQECSLLVDCGPDANNVVGAPPKDCLCNCSHAEKYGGMDCRTILPPPPTPSLHLSISTSESWPSLTWTETLTGSRSIPSIAWTSSTSLKTEAPTSTLDASMSGTADTTHSFMETTTPSLEESKSLTLSKTASQHTFTLQETRSHSGRSPTETSSFHTETNVATLSISPPSSTKTEEQTRSPSPTHSQKTKTVSLGNGSHTLTITPWKSVPFLFISQPTFKALSERKLSRPFDDESRALLELTVVGNVQWNCSYFFEKENDIGKSRARGVLRSTPPPSTSSAAVEDRNSSNTSGALFMAQLTSFFPDGNKQEDWFGCSAQKIQYIFTTSKDYSIDADEHIYFHFPSFRSVLIEEGEEGVNFDFIASLEDHVTIIADRPTSPLEAPKMQTAQTVGQASTFVALAAVNPALVVQANRLKLPLLVAQCQDHTEEDLDFMSHPTQLKLKYERKRLQQYAGAVWGNSALLLALFFAHVFLVFVVYVFGLLCCRKNTKRKLSFQWAMSKVSFPGFQNLLILLFLQPLSMEVMTLLLQTKGIALSLGIAWAVLASFLMYLLWLFRLTCWHFCAVLVPNLELKNKLNSQCWRIGWLLLKGRGEWESRIVIDHEEEFQEKVQIDKKAKLTIEDGEAQRLKHSTVTIGATGKKNADEVEAANNPMGALSSSLYFSEKYGQFFDMYRSERQWFILVETAFSIVTGLMEGIHPQTLVGCKALLAILACLFVCFFFTVVALRPYQAPVETIFSFIICLLQATAMLWVWILSLSGNVRQADLSTVSDLIMIGFYFVAVKALLDIVTLLWEGGLMMWQACGGAKEESQKRKSSEEKDNVEMNALLHRPLLQIPEMKNSVEKKREEKDPLDNNPLLSTSNMTASHDVASSSWLQNVNVSNPNKNYSLNVSAAARWVNDQGNPSLHPDGIQQAESITDDSDFEEEDYKLFHFSMDQALKKEREKSAEMIQTLHQIRAKRDEERKAPLPQFSTTRQEKAEKQKGKHKQVPETKEGKNAGVNVNQKKSKKKHDTPAWNPLLPRELQPSVLQKATRQKINADRGKLRLETSTFHDLLEFRHSGELL